MHHSHFRECCQGVATAHGSIPQAHEIRAHVARFISSWPADIDDRRHRPLAPNAPCDSLAPRSAQAMPSPRTTPRALASSHPDQIRLPSKLVGPAALSIPVSAAQESPQKVDRNLDTQSSHERCQAVSEMTVNVCNRARISWVVGYAQRMTPGLTRNKPSSPEAERSRSRCPF